MHMSILVRRLLCLVALLWLVGCKEVLYSDLPEGQANDMVEVLAAAGIEASRERDKSNVYTVLVDEAHIAAAITILKNNGLPRESFQTLGDVFSAEGIVGTPFEERARFIHAMNQELSYTISDIAGVRRARVHVMLPEQTRFRTVEDPARASVIIHVERDFEAEEFVPTIKNLVVHSVANLEYEDVAVAVFPAGGPVVTDTSAAPVAGGSPAEAGTADMLGIAMPRGSAASVVRLDALLFILAAGFVLWMMLSGIVRRLGLTWRRNG